MDNIKKTRKYVQEGSTTLEAAIVVPIIMSIIVAVIYMSFYLYDRVIMEAIAYKILSEAVQDKNMSEKKVEESALENIYEKTILAKNIGAECIKDEEKLILTYSAECKIPLYYMKKLLNINRIHVNASYIYPINRTTLYKYRVLKDAISDIKGGGN
ncbi:MAG: TadE family protein [Eubacterium sp.]